MSFGKSACRIDAAVSHKLYLYLTPLEPENHLSSGPKLLICATGAIATVSIPSYLLRLKTDLGAEVSVVMSSNAARFLPPETVGLFCDKILGAEDRHDGADLFREVWNTDLLLVLPSSANVIAAAACGLATNSVSSAILANERPSAFFPSMNRRLWEKSVVQRNCETLRADNHYVHEPEYRRGYEVADGTFDNHPTLPPPQELVAIVRRLLENSNDEAMLDAT